MFPLFYGLFYTIGKLIYDGRAEYGKTQSRIDAMDKKKETYIDNFGREWIIDPYGKDKRVFHNYDVMTGHDVLTDAKTGKVLIDYTARNIMHDELEFIRLKKEAKEKAIQEGKKCYSVFYIAKENGLIDQRSGYYEVETDRKYVLSSSGKKYKDYHLSYCIPTKRENKIDMETRGRSLSYDEYLSLGGPLAKLR